MSGNDGSGNNEDRDSWETPQKLFDKLNKQYNFSLDCCATKGNSKCIFWENDFLNRTFTNNNNASWMNPPFSKAKEMIEHFFKIIKKGVLIYRFDNPETYLWKFIYEKADWIFVFRGRVNYEGMEGKGSRFPSALAGIGVEPPKDIEGTVFFSRISATN